MICLVNTGDLFNYTINGNRLGLILKGNIAYFFALERLLHLFIAIFANNNLVFCGGVLQPGGGVHGVANDRVV